MEVEKKIKELEKRIERLERDIKNIPLPPIIGKKFSGVPPVTRWE